MHVICQIHLPYTGYFCPERLFKSSNEKSSEVCIREQFVTRMVRYDGEIENGDFNKGKNPNVGLFWYVFVPTERILERGAKIRDLLQINNFESAT